MKIMLLHPLSVPHPLFPKPPPKKPLLPPQQQSKIKIMKIQLIPLLLPLLSHPMPQFVAAKSLMYEPPICYYNVSYVSMLAQFPFHYKESYTILFQ